VPEFRGALETDGAAVLFEWQGLAVPTDSGMRQLLSGLVHTTDDPCYHGSTTASARWKARYARAPTGPVSRSCLRSRRWSGKECHRDNIRPCMQERTNQQWPTGLRGPNPDEPLADLHDLLARGLRTAMGGRTDDVDASMEDFAQEALLKITSNLDSFRGRAVSPPGRRRSP
jgi:hypothetical protein